MKTTITITNMRVSCIVGVSEKERSKSQEILITIKLNVDAKKASETDNVSDTINYRELYTSIYQLVSKSKFYLLEALAKHIVTFCLQYTQVKKIKVAVTKPTILQNTDGVTVTIEDEKHT
jgi:D-erythro-7,8-dihydroneopterin triphosphate epimerase